MHETVCSLVNIHEASVKMYACNGGTDYTGDVPPLDGKVGGGVDKKRSRWWLGDDNEQPSPPVALHCPESQQQASSWASARRALSPLRQMNGTGRPAPMQDLSVGGHRQAVKILRSPHGRAQCVVSFFVGRQDRSRFAYLEMKSGLPRKQRFQESGPGTR